MMSVIQPVAFTPALLVSTTATDTTPAWVSGTSYALGAKVTRTDPTRGLPRIWQSLIAANTTEPSYANATSWLDIGPTNKMAMFDSQISTKTTATGSLVVELAPGDVVSSLAMLNLVGTSVQVEMIVNGATVYDSTKSLVATWIADWWDYYFAKDDQLTQAIFNDLPMFYSPRLRITVTGVPGTTVAVGHCVFGSRQELGMLGMGAQSGIIDYSRKDTDEFGETTFVQRAFADEFSGQILVHNNRLNGIKRLLRDLRATPCLWIGVDDDTYTETLMVFGWYRQHRVAINYPNHSLIDLEIEGLT